MTLYRGNRATSGDGTAIATAYSDNPATVAANIVALTTRMQAL